MAVALWTAVAIDCCRSPSDQLTAGCYVGLVRGYQYSVRRHLAKYIRCRYSPSCSEYSIDAVRRYGICKGLSLSVQRVARCTRDVPCGTEDPVPGTE